jgi:hypothetical protein
MGISYANLDDTTRRYMLEESRSGGHYMSPRLTTAGLAAWVALFEGAIESRDDDWLAAQLESRGFMRTEESYVRSGRTHWRAVPHNAAQQLAEGEFNRYYIRGLCLRAKAEGISEVVVYRGKAVQSPRPQSQALIGTRIPVDALLADLRNSDFVDTALGIPAGPNSGITARLPG